MMYSEKILNEKLHELQKMWRSGAEITKKNLVIFVIISPNLVKNLSKFSEIR